MTGLTRNSKKLRGLSSSKLEAEANRWLYGAATVPIRTDGEQYKRPKYVSTAGACAGCKKPRHAGSARLCRACYLKKAKAKRRASGKDKINASVYLDMAEVGHEGIGETYERIRVVRAHDDDSAIEMAAPSERPHYSEEQAIADKSSVAALYVSGKTYAQISEAVNRPTWFVYQAVHKTCGQSRQKKLNRKQKLEILLRYRFGERPQGIAFGFGIGYRRVLDVCRKMRAA